jgi:hypothetical protein
MPPSREEREPWSIEQHQTFWWTSERTPSQKLGIFFCPLVALRGSGIEGDRGQSSKSIAFVALIHIFVEHEIRFSEPGVTSQRDKSHHNPLQIRRFNFRRRTACAARSLDTQQSTAFWMSFV